MPLNTMLHGSRIQAYLWAIIADTRYVAELFSYPLILIGFPQQFWQIVVRNSTYGVKRRGSKERFVGSIASKYISAMLTFSTEI